MGQFDKPRGKPCKINEKIDMKNSKELADLGWEGPRDRYVLGTSSHVCSWKTVKMDGAEESVVIYFLLLRGKAWTRGNW